MIWKIVSILNCINVYTVCYISIQNYKIIQYLIKITKDEQIEKDVVYSRSYCPKRPTKNTKFPK